MLDVIFDPEVNKIENIASDIKSRLHALESKFKDYRFTVEGADSQDEEAEDWIGNILYSCLAGIFLVIAVTLKSTIRSFLVGLTVLFGVGSVVWALYAHGYIVSLLGIIGIIGVAGVAVNDSLILIDTIEKKYQDGQKKSFCYY